MNLMEYIYSTMTKEEKAWLASEEGKKRFAEFIKKRGLCGCGCGKKSGTAKKTAKGTKRAQNSVRQQRST